MPAKQYDIIVWGATGFTGKLVCQHLAAHAPTDLKWGAAGRRESALKAVTSKDFLGPLCRCPPLGIEVGDATDEAAAVRIAKSARLVLATAGPFTFHSAAILKACAENGTHYVDITGEAMPYVHASVHSHHETAIKTGAKIVHCCGYDSVPSDLLTQMAIDVLRDLGQMCDSATVGFDLLQTAGTMSGGTLHTICAIMAHLQATPSDVPIAINAQCLCPDVPPPSALARLYSLATGGDAWHLPGCSAALNGQWHFMFGMAISNTKIVRRSRALLKDVPDAFVYREVMTCGRGLVGMVIALSATFGFLFSGLLLLPPVRWLLTWLVPSGFGPSLSMQNHGKWRAEVVAEGSAGGRAWGEALALRQDPGYKSTAMMVAQTALSVLDVSRTEGALAATTSSSGIAFSSSSPYARTWRGGGVLTPASACGAKLLAERFEKHGLLLRAAAVPDAPSSYAPIVLLLACW